MTSFRALLFALGSLVLVYTIMVVANEGVTYLLQLSLRSPILVGRVSST